MDVSKPESGLIQAFSDLEMSKDVKIGRASETLNVIVEDASPAMSLPSSSPNAVPDGGIEAWLQVLGSWVVLAQTWGLINCFGVYQSFYETELLRDSSSSSISWIGSIQGGLLLIIAIISGPLYDAGYFREQLVVGTIFIVLGQFTTSFCWTYWQILVSQGICIGIGMGLIYLPATAILAQYFQKYRALAIGIAGTGSPIAGIVFPIIFNVLEPRIGFSWTTRVISFILLGLSAIPLIVMHGRTELSGTMRCPYDRTVFKDAPFSLSMLGAFLIFLTGYVPFFYIAIFADAHGLWTPDSTPYLITILNAGSVFGRIVPNAMADRLGSLNIAVICTAACTVLMFAWMAIRNLGWLVVFALLYGFFSGGAISLLSSVYVSLTPDLSKLGTRMGMACMLSGISLLIGTPIGGAILFNFSEERWLGMIGYGGAGLVLALVLLVTAKFLKMRESFGQNV